MRNTVRVCDLLLSKETPRTSKIRLINSINYYIDLTCILTARTVIVSVQTCSFNYVSTATSRTFRECHFVRKHDISQCGSSLRVSRRDLHCLQPYQCLVNHFLNHLLLSTLEIIMPKISSYARTQIELLHNQGLHPAGILKSLKGEGVVVSLSSITCCIFSSFLLILMHVLHHAK